jgi:hypothetical protein
VLCDTAHGFRIMLCCSTLLRHDQVGGEHLPVVGQCPRWIRKAVLHRLFSGRFFLLGMFPNSRAVSNAKG